MSRPKNRIVAVGNKVFSMSPKNFAKTLETRLAGTVSPQGRSLGTVDVNLDTMSDQAVRSLLDALTAKPEVTVTPSTDTTSDNVIDF